MVDGEDAIDLDVEVQPREEEEMGAGAAQDPDVLDPDAEVGVFWEAQSVSADSGLPAHCGYDDEVPGDVVFPDPLPLLTMEEVGRCLRRGPDVERPLDVLAEISSLYELLLSSGASEVDCRMAIAEMYSPPRVIEEAEKNPG